MWFYACGLLHILWICEMVDKMDTANSIFSYQFITDRNHLNICTTDMHDDIQFTTYNNINCRDMPCSCARWLE